MDTKNQYNSRYTGRCCHLPWPSVFQHKLAKERKQLVRPELQPVISVSKSSQPPQRRMTLEGEWTGRQPVRRRFRNSRLPSGQARARACFCARWHKGPKFCTDWGGAGQGGTLWSRFYGCLGAGKLRIPMCHSPPPEGEHSATRPGSRGTEEEKGAAALPPGSTSPWSWSASRGSLHRCWTE